MKRNIKRILSLLLVLCMVAGLLPVSAMAMDMYDFEWTFTDGKYDVVHKCTQSGKLTTTIDPAQPGKEGTITSRCPNCGRSDSKRIPAPTADWWTTVPGDNWTGTYNGTLQTFDSEINASKVVTASDGSSYTVGQLLGGNDPDIRVGFKNANSGFIQVFIGMTDYSGGDTSYNGHSLVYTPSGIILDERMTLKPMIITPENVPDDGPDHLYIADGTNLAANWVVRFKDETGGYRNMDMKIFPSDYTYKPDADGSGGTYSFKNYEWEDSGSISSITEPGLYDIIYQVPMHGEAGVLDSNYALTFSEDSPGHFLVGTRTRVRVWVAPSSVDDSNLYAGFPYGDGEHAVGGINDEPLDTTPSSSLWKFGFSSSMGNAEGVSEWLKKPGSYKAVLIAVRKDSPYQSNGLLMTPGFNVEVKQFTYHDVQKPTVKEAFPTAGTPFADLGLSETTDIIMKTTTGDYTDQYFGIRNVTIDWDESSYDPNTPGPQTITGVVKPTAEQAAYFIDPGPINVSVQVTVRPKVTASYTWEDKVAEYTGSPISHEISGGTGIASVAYNYKSSDGTYDSATPPTNPGVYLVTATFTMASGYDQLPQDTSQLTITKKSQTLPDTAKDPTLKEATINSIELNVPTGGATYEYAIKNTDGEYDWQDSPLFTGLDPDTNYTFVQRVKGDAVTDPSPNSNEATFKTLIPGLEVTISADKNSVKYGEPINLTAKLNSSLGDSVSYTYEWYKDGTLVPGANTSTLMLTDVAQSGRYTCKVSATLSGTPYDDTSNEVSVEITASSIPDEIPEIPKPGDDDEKWDQFFKEYVDVSNLTYGDALSNAKPVVDKAALKALHPDKEALIDSLVASFQDGGSTFPTVNDYKNNLKKYVLVISSSNPNYETTSGNISSNLIPVDPAELTVKASDESITWGDEYEFKASYSGWKLGDGVSDLLGTVSFTCAYNVLDNDISGSPYVVTPSGYLESQLGVTTNYSNYTFNYQPGSLRVAQKSFDVSIEDADITYGDELPEWKFTVAGLGSYDSSIQTLVNNAAKTDITVTVDPAAGDPVDAGDYTLKLSYSGTATDGFTFNVTGDGAMNVDPLDVTVVWEGADDDILYDGTDHLDEISAYFMDENGERVELTVKATQSGGDVELSERGSYLLIATLDPDSGNYNLTNDEKPINVIDPGTTTNVTFPTASNIQWGQTVGDSVLTGGNGGMDGNGTYSWVDPDTKPLPGVHYFPVAFTPDPSDDTDYSTELGWDEASGTVIRQVKLTVDKKDATKPGVDWGDLVVEKVYDGNTSVVVMASDILDIDPADDFTLTIRGTYDTKDAGTGKPVTLTLTGSGADADKYDYPATYETTGTITPAPLSIAVKDTDLQFGDPLSMIGVTVTGLIPGESLTDLTGDLVYDYDGYSQWDDVPGRDLTVSVSGLTSGNYDIDYKDGTVTVSKRELTVVPDDFQFKFFGDPDPATYPYIVTDGMPEDIPDPILEEMNSVAVTLSREPGEDVGLYDYVLAAADTTNFTWVLDDAVKFSIQPLSVNVVWTGLDNEYVANGTNQSGSISAYYVDKDGNQVQLTIEFKRDGSSTIFQEVGDYDLTAVGTDKNYELNNATAKVKMLAHHSGGDGSETNVKFPSATPILKGESLGDSTFYGDFTEDGTFEWEDPSIVPDVGEGSFGVIYTPDPNDDTDYSDELGYNPADGTIEREVPILVLDGPITPDVPGLLEDPDGLKPFRDKLYDDTTASPFEDSLIPSLLASDGLDIMNRNDSASFTYNFASKLFGEYAGILQELGQYGLLNVVATGTYNQSDVNTDIPLTFAFTVSGRKSRLVDLPTSVDTTGNIEKIILVVEANDHMIQSTEEYEANGVSFPEKYTGDWDAPVGEVWYYGFVGDDSEADLGGTLTYSFNENGSGEIEIMPAGLTSNNYELRYAPGILTVLDPGEIPDPVIEDVGNDFIEVKPIKDGEYSIDGGKTWQDDPIFDGLTPDTEYEIIQRIPSTENPGDYIVSDPVKVKTDPEVPLPEVDEKGDDFIHLKPIPDGEYSNDGGDTWQDSPEFGGLQPGKDYEIVQRVPDPNNPGDYIESDPIIVGTDPDIPEPVVEDKGDDFIELKPIDDGEYSIDGGNTWQDDPIFEGLDPDTEYEIIQRIPDPDEPGRYVESDPIYVTTDKETPEVPLPEVDEKGDDFIHLKPIEDGEYSNDGGKTWQDSPDFDDLEPGKDYEIIQRVPDPNNPGEYIESDPIIIPTDPENPFDPGYEIIYPDEEIKFDDDKYDVIDKDGNPIEDGGKIEPGEEITIIDKETGEEITIKVPDRPSAPDVTVDFDRETVNTDTDMEYSTDGGKTWKPCDKDMDISDLVGQDILIRYPATDDSFASESAVVKLPARPDAPIVSWTDESEAGAADGTITDVNASMEYSTDGGITWTDCPADGTIDGLSEGVYLVRVKATEDSFCSFATVVKIGVGDGSGTAGDDDGPSWGTGNGHGGHGDDDRWENNWSGIYGDDNSGWDDGSSGICPSEKYVDVDQTLWYHDALDFTVVNKFMTGVSSNEWAPDQAMTRSMFVAVLYRLVGAPTGYANPNFTDVPVDSWCYNAVAWAYAVGVTSGTSATTFSPSEAISYQQMATMFYDFCKAYGFTMITGSTTTTVSSDSQVADYAKEALSAMANTGIFNVNGNTSISATGTMTRATAAQVITNFCTAFSSQINGNTDIQGMTGGIYLNPGVSSLTGVLFS